MGQLKLLLKNKPQLSSFKKAVIPQLVTTLIILFYKFTILNLSSDGFTIKCFKFLPLFSTPEIGYFYILGVDTFCMYLMF